eukprot:Gb_27686 [translate_table: standard]
MDQERHCDGKTAIHYVVQLKDGNDAVAMEKLLINNCKSKEEKALLLWASTVGISTAEESLTSQNRTANDPIKELLTRRGSISSLRDATWRDQLQQNEEQNVEKGRNICADGLAALFLNPYVKSPITIGIFGEWGMGNKASCFRSFDSFLATDQEFTTKENPLLYFLENSQPKYRAVFKSLALMDRSDMVSEL